MEGTIIGIYDYHKEKKKNKRGKKKNRLKKELRKKEKKLNKMCYCNHIAKNTGKRYLKKIYDENGNHIYNKCKICKGKMIVDPSLLTVESIKAAAEILYTEYSLVKGKVPLKPNLNNDISKAMYFIMKAPDVIEGLIEKEKDKKRKKNKDGKKKNKKKRKKNIRADY